jgi:hypothetical protein
VQRAFICINLISMARWSAQALFIYPLGHSTKQAHFIGQYA